MAIIQSLTKLLSGSVAAGTSGTIGTFDLASEGPGGTNIDNVTIVVIARSIEHGPTVTHEHQQISAIYKRTSGSITGIGGTFPDVKNNGDFGGNFSNIVFDTDATNTIFITATSAFGGDTPKAFSGVWHIIVAT